MQSSTQLTDSNARSEIENNLEVCMLVEAGAGSGKTTSLIKRMLKHIKTGTRVESIAAVTFTRKAANELRERFQVALEAALHQGDLSDEEAACINKALDDINKIFIGTIHSFCGRLLREYPLEVGLDPNFSEVTDEDWDDLCADFWNNHLERSLRNSDPDYEAMLEVGISPRGLLETFKSFVNNSDVSFVYKALDMPDVSKVRADLNSLLSDIEPLVPRVIPDDGWDNLMVKVRGLLNKRKRPEWNDAVSFCNYLDNACKTEASVVQKRWGDSKEVKLLAKAASEDFNDFIANAAGKLLYDWRSYRYQFAMKFLEQAAKQFEELRRATGKLSFNDLLRYTGTLLRDNYKVRDSLGIKFRFLLVDEFQDTDPMQAEICFLLASPSTEGNVWQKVTPRDGSLFFVGDPKQSIYRFRRADIQIYDFAKKRISELGLVVALTQNFRSTAVIGGLVNKYFEKVFPESATAHQAPFSKMDTVKESSNSCISLNTFEYSTARTGNNSPNGNSPPSEATLIASYIYSRVVSGQNKPGDFLILTEKRKEIAEFARELALRNVPVATTGAPLLQESELVELCVVLRALADPENPIAIAAALEGTFIGCTPEDLFYAKKSGHSFTAIRPPKSTDCAVGQGLELLNSWWQSGQRMSGDELLELIYVDTGVLYYAATQDLGDGRAGVLMHIVDSLRAMPNACSISEAVERINMMIEQDEADDTPLRAGHGDVVRIMNLHKSKGLEAKIVFLAGSGERKNYEPKIVVARDENGEAIGYLNVSDNSGHGVAHSDLWSDVVRAESLFSAAEAQRLLYVAVTRAEEELIITVGTKVSSKGEKTLIRSLWSHLHPLLEDNCERLVHSPVTEVGRIKPSSTLYDIQQQVSVAKKRVEAAGQKSYVTGTVTQSARERRDVEHALYTLASTLPRDMENDNMAVAARGARWGSAVHRSIEGMGRGRSGLNLERFVRAVCADEGLSIVEATEILEILEQLQKTKEWRAISTAPERRFELKVSSYNSDHRIGELLEGVLDVAYLDGDSWKVIDWKTDSVSKEVWTQREGKYLNQVSVYADMLKQLTGKEASFKLTRL